MPELGVLGDASDGLCSRYRAGLLEDPLEVSLHRVDADEQRVGDLLIRNARGKKRRDLAFPFGKSEVVARPTAPTRATGHGADDDLTTIDRFKRVEELLGWG